MHRLVRNPLISHRCLTSGEESKVGSRERMPHDLRELEDFVVKKQAALHRLTGILFAMARHMDPIGVPHRLENAFDRRFLALQAYHGEPAGQTLYLFNFILCFGYGCCIWC